MTVLKLTQIGNSVGVILPKEILARLKLEKGDSLYVTDAAQVKDCANAIRSMHGVQRAGGPRR